jgi:Protein of unknown function (DUF5818)
MAKTLILTIAFLVSAAWLQAQQPPPASSQPKDTAASQKVEGCLQGSGGNFTLTDNSGVTYQLQGDTAKLTDHVGHEVQITGSPAGASAGSSSSTAAGAGSQPTLEVKSVKHVPKTCKAASK